MITTSHVQESTRCHYIESFCAHEGVYRDSHRCSPLQVEGGFVQGMGWTCLEELVWGDEDHKWLPPGVLHTRGPGDQTFCQLSLQRRSCMIPCKVGWVQGLLEPLKAAEGQRPYFRRSWMLHQ